MITERPEFALHGFGIKIQRCGYRQCGYDLTRATFCAGLHNQIADEGTALELFGGDYRFTPRSIGTGPIQKAGTLQGTWCWWRAEI